MGGGGGSRPEDGTIYMDIYIYYKYIILSYYIYYVHIHINTPYFSFKAC